MITMPIIARTGSRLLLAVCLLLGGIVGNDCLAATKGDKWKAAIPEKKYDPNTKAYCDFLWMRVHEETCPALVMKDMKKVITLEQADKEGWRIGLTGQSGNDHCCFHGYRRKYPRKEITDEDTFGIVTPMKRGRKHKFHQAGCHRTKVKAGHTMPMTLREAKKLKGYYICAHCVNRGPSVTRVTKEGLAKMPVAKEPPAWSRKPVPADKLPPQKEIDMLVEEYSWSGGGGGPTPFEDPRAQAEELITRRFFFSFSDVYKLYRATGDKRLLDKLHRAARGSAYNICVKYPSAAQAKAKGPEGANFLFSVVAWPRITLQLARKGKASQKEIAEAEAMLKAVVVALKRHWYWEGDTGLDPKMGIPQQLADNFRRSAYNRCANGIGTVATASKALEDLQVIKKTKAYQRTIDCYRKCVQEWIKNWENKGCMYTEADGKTYFYYTYNGTGKKREDGLMTGGSDDIYHYSYSVEGATLIWEAAPELGVDDDFMTAIANAVYHNAGTKHGSIQCPSADRIKPVSRKPGPGVAVPLFYGLEAFRDGLIDASCQRLSEAKKFEINSDKHRLGGRRVRTMFAHYLKALRKDRSIIHLGEKN